MKRILKIVGLVVLLIVVGVGTLIAVTFMGRKAIVDGQEVNGIRIIEDGITSLVGKPIDAPNIATASPEAPVVASRMVIPGSKGA